MRQALDEATVLQDAWSLLALGKQENTTNRRTTKCDCYKDEES